MGKSQLDRLVRDVPVFQQSLPTIQTIWTLTEETVSTFIEIGLRINKLPFYINLYAVWK